MTTSYSHNLKTSLESLKKTVTKENQISPKVKNAILILIEHLLENENNINKYLKERQQSIDKSFKESKEPPFSWNNNVKGNQDENFNRDREQYRQLIIYSAMFENHDLLKTWGIEYPFSKNACLAKSVDDYLEEFTIWSQNQSIFKKKLGIDYKEIEPYLTYLINEFKKIKSR